MRERPILFSAPMVRALLDGSKTQTRRPVKRMALEWLQPGGFAPSFVADPENHLCPYGVPGDRLWVRETWQYADWTEDGEPVVEFRADNGRRVCEGIPEDWADRLESQWMALSTTENYGIDGRAADRRWRPAIHMPRWASRITLEVADVRVERLQAISEVDAKEEGVTMPDGTPTPPDFWSYAQEYGHLWDRINGAGAWDTNPWVWVVSFRIAPTQHPRTP